MKFSIVLSLFSLLSLLHVSNSASREGDDAKLWALTHIHEKRWHHEYHIDFLTDWQLDDGSETEETEITLEDDWDEFEPIDTDNELDEELREEQWQPRQGAAKSKLDIWEDTVVKAHAKHGRKYKRRGQRLKEKKPTKGSNRRRKLEDAIYGDVEEDVGVVHIPSAERIEQTFRFFDRNADDIVSKEEIRSVLLRHKYPSEWRHVDLIHSLLDANGDGLVHRSEYTGYLTLSTSAVKEAIKNKEFTTEEMRILAEKLSFISFAGMEKHKYHTHQI